MPTSFKFQNNLRDLDIAGKTVFVRLDLNVPLRDGVIQDDTRILKALPTLQYILEKARGVVVCSHLGRPKGQVVEELSLAPVGNRLAELTGKEVILFNNYVEEPVEAYLTQLQKDQFVLLENLRFNPGETKNERAFASCLAKGMQIFVNDAFGTSHRAHASVVGVSEIVGAEFSAPGFLLEKEIEALSGVRDKAATPFSVVIGGAKVSDKMGVMLSLLEKCNHMLVGGAMAYSFLKAKGVEVGTSLVEEDKMDLVEAVFKTAEAHNVTIHLPTDHVVASEFSNNAKAITTDGADIPAGHMGLDIGPKTVKAYQGVLNKSKTILWNGPMGVFEWDQFSAGTLAIGHTMADCEGAFTVVGGGDSVSAAQKAGVSDRIDHISTGGGASLEFLEGKVLPGIKALQKN